jgi:hypothetical protein
MPLRPSLATERRCSVKNFEEFLWLGMKRSTGHLQSGPNRFCAIDVGGNTVIKDSPYTRAAGWDALSMALLREGDDTIGTIYCFHFLEHLTGHDALMMLREFERVLVPGGVANIVTPYYNSQMQAHDLDHRSVWCEETWKIIFDTPYYGDKGKWLLRVNFCLIAGVVERNLALFTQLGKVE